MLNEDVIDFFDSYVVMQEMVGNNKILNIDTYDGTATMGCRWFNCYVNPTKKNIKIDMIIGRNNYDELCKKLDAYLKRKTPARKPGVSNEMRIFKIEFKGSELEKFKAFMQEYIFDYFEKRGKK